MNCSKVFVWSSFLLIFSILWSTAFGIERRRDQFQADFGYLVAPFPFILPGVGTGLGILAGANNIGETQVDLNSVIIRGDVNGGGLIMTDLHLLPNTLLIDLVTFEISAGQQNAYLERGMTSDPDEFNIVELEDSKLVGGRAILTFFDRMFEIYNFTFETEFRVTAIRDSEGELQNEIQNPPKNSFKASESGVLIDYTDDRLDPREGIRLEFSRAESPPANDNSPDFHTDDYSLTFYVPILSYSTWAFNYYRSDAIVRTKGEIDPEILKLEYGCTETEFAQCNEAIQGIVQDRIAQNTYGTSSGLGGQSRLRAFNQGRFSAAHTEFFGTEIRWNLTDEQTPYDIFFMKDVRTGIQLALFYEVGTVADLKEDLWKEQRSTVGAGARLITGSGFVYRFDVATGEEGGTVVLFFGYPWTGF